MSDSPNPPVAQKILKSYTALRDGRWSGGCLRRPLAQNIFNPNPEEWVKITDIAEIADFFVDFCDFGDSPARRVEMWRGSV